MQKRYRIDKPGLYEIWLSVFSVLSLQFCSLRPVFKYLPHPAFIFILILLGSFTAYFLLIHNRSQINKFLNSFLLTVILIFLVLALSVYFFPLADALKFQGRGSDADDAVIIASSKLFAGQFPYDQLTYLNHKMSPGPGILIFMGPFVLTHTYSLAIPFYVFLFFRFCSKRFKDFQIPNLALLFLLSSFGFIEYMIIGSDLAIISILISILTYLILIHHDHFKKMVILSIFFGLVITSRTTLIYYIPALACILFRLNRKSGFILGFLGVFTCIVIHACFYFWDLGHYSPLHLMNKGMVSTNTYVFVSGILCNLTIYILFLKKKKINIKSSLAYAWLFLAVPHLFIGIGMIITDHFLFAKSEGPGYLIIQVFPFLLYFICYMSELNNHKDARANGFLSTKPTDIK